MSQIAAGRTPLRKSIELCGRCNGATIFVKDESKNPFGTFKDRRCAALLETHAGRKELLFVHITSGNSGYSMGMLAKEFERQTGKKRTVVNIVPKGLPKSIKQRLETCSIVVEADLGAGIVTQDAIRSIARKAAEYRGPEEGMVGVEDYGLGNGYRAIVKEISEQGVKPTHIFCPVGEGELAVELAAACESVWGKDAPKVIGVTIRQNVILEKGNFLKKAGKSVADKLVNGYSKFKELLLNFVKSGRMELVTANEGSIAKEYEFLNGIGIAVEPSAAAAFVGAESHGLKEGDVAVVVNTGKGLYDARSVGRMWLRRLKKALVYGLMGVMGAALAFVGAWSYGLHGARARKSLEYKTYENIEKDAKSKGVGHTEELELPCRFLVEKRDAKSELAPEIIKGICSGVTFFRMSDGYLEFYNSYKNQEFMMQDMITRDVMRDLVRRYNGGEYDPTMMGSMGRVGKWFRSTFNEWTGRDVWKFYFHDEGWPADPIDPVHPLVGREKPRSWMPPNAK